MTRAEPFEFVEASIEEVLEAFRSRKTTARLLLDQYLARIEAYDRGPDGLNSIVVMNPLAEAQADESDLRWNAGTARAFGGIPFTVKDSYMAQGLTVAAGSPAFRDLQAQWDAFTASKLRGAGAVLIGKTNIPPMADGGMQRGVYGGMGKEAVPSGRSPSSNNALCAFTPSLGRSLDPRKLAPASRRRCRRAPHAFDVRHAASARCHRARRRGNTRRLLAKPDRSQTAPTEPTQTTDLSVARKY